MVQASHRLKSYNGGNISVTGCVELPVQVNSQKLESFTFYVVPNGQLLMGVDLFDAIGFRIVPPEESHTVDTVIPALSPICCMGITVLLLLYPEDELRS